MPLYMDRHDLSPAVTAENVAELHHKDLKIQHLYNCRGLTYWFDQKKAPPFVWWKLRILNHYRKCMQMRMEMFPIK